MQDSIKTCPHYGGTACLNSDYDYNKVSVCVYPHKYGCKGCQYNGVPSLFDGGCILLKKQALKSP